MVLIPKGCYMLSYYLTKSWVFQRCINIFIEQEDKRETHISHDQLVIEKLDQWKTSAMHLLFHRVHIATWDMPFPSSCILHFLYYYYFLKYLNDFFFFFLMLSKIKSWFHLWSFVYYYFNSLLHYKHYFCYIQPTQLFFAYWSS